MKRAYQRGHFPQFKYETDVSLGDENPADLRSTNMSADFGTYIFFSLKIKESHLNECQHFYKVSDCLTHEILAQLSIFKN